MTPICIAGMHRSGTSMVASLLQGLGVYLGEDVDFSPAREGENTGGFREHFGFYALNERLLEHLAAGWDMPELPSRWETRSDLAPFRENAMLLMERMAVSAGARRWGWKDPRNSITVQFWKTLLPELTVVICVRDPAEVAESLRRKHNISPAAARRLWLRHYGNLLDNIPPKNRVVTFYENYFSEFEDEMKRVADALGLAVDNASIAAAASRVKLDLRHHHAADRQFSHGEYDSEIEEMYLRLRAETRPVSHPPSATLELVKAKFNAETAQREEHIRHLANENVALREALANLTTKLDQQGEQFAMLLREQRVRSQVRSHIVQKSIAVHGAIGKMQERYTHIQRKIELTLKEKNSALPRWIRYSTPVNSLYRHFKRIRKFGKLLAIQRELNDAVSDALGTLTHFAAMLSAESHPYQWVPPGLEWSHAGTVQTDVSHLMESIRERLA